jgi:glycosyltransferase involved in cell wall biosynthesis
LEEELIQDLLVTVIIPVYNGSNYLRQSIGSVLNQTYPNIELIVVNDGSNDETEDIALSFGTKLKYFFQSNSGVSAALNKGIIEAKGIYIAWLSHDDYFLPNKIEKQINCLRKNPDSQICYTNYNVIDNFGEHQTIIKLPHYETNEFSIHLLQAMFICGSTVLLKRDCFIKDEIFFDETLKYAQDADLWMKLSMKYKYVHINECLLNWRFHPGQGSRNVFLMRQDKRKYLLNTIDNFNPDNFFQKYSKLHNFKALAFNRLAIIMLKCHREPILAFYLLRKSIKSSPSIKNKAYLYIFFLSFAQFYYYFGLWLFSKIRFFKDNNNKYPNVDFVMASKAVNIKLK